MMRPLTLLALGTLSFCGWTLWRSGLRGDNAGAVQTWEGEGGGQAQTMSLPLAAGDAAVYADAAERASSA